VGHARPPFALIAVLLVLAAVPSVGAVESDDPCDPEALFCEASGTVCSYDGESCNEYTVTCDRVASLVCVGRVNSTGTRNEPECAQDGSSWTDRTILRLGTDEAQFYLHSFNSCYKETGHPAAREEGASAGVVLTGDLTGPLVLQAIYEAPYPIAETAGYLASGRAVAFTWYKEQEKGETSRGVAFVVHGGTLYVHWYGETACWATLGYENDAPVNLASREGSVPCPQSPPPPPKPVWEPFLP